VVRSLATGVVVVVVVDDLRLCFLQVVVVVAFVVDSEVDSVS
jgi:hypothetical protein